MTIRDRTHIQTIDGYIAALAARLTVTPEAQATILEEIGGHLQDAAAAEQARGVPANEAEGRAVAAFGAVKETARSLNATLPVDWDLRRMAQGLLLGALSIWFTWTLVTFPFLVQMAIEHHLDTVATLPGSLIFSASPLSFGLFYTLREGPWAALLIVALFGAIAFVLGSRASQGWRAGLAFGLGVFVSMPFLFLTFVFHDREILPQQMLPAIVPIWLLVPYAVGAASLGARIARRRNGRNLGHTSLAMSAPRRIPRAVVAGLIVLMMLLGFNGWSFVRATTMKPVVNPPLAQQLAAAQRAVSFTIRQPRYLPAGTALTQVSIDSAWCGARCSVSLEYLGPHGVYLDLGEIPHNPAESSQPGPIAIPTPPTSPNAPDAYSTMSTVGYHPVWWLGGVETQEPQSTLAWDDGNVFYILNTNGPLSADELRQIAASLAE
ncbi:MAG TPA: permease prefix domain 1-containing protein [Ktedonobacterales bacterium]|nr:permease prefix domain 1-containing protein [Ktedonobacterales bacterium]